MGIEYKWLDWNFNRDLWAETVSKAIDAHGLLDLAEMLDIDHSSLGSWAKNRYYKGFNYPSMTNFLKVVNLLNLNPAHFWALEQE